MATIRRQRLLPYTCHQIFDLVADIESYPHFVPHYEDARIVHEGDGHRVVDQTLAVSGVRLRVRTGAELQRPSRIRVHGRHWPLRHLDAHWQFDPVPSGCQTDYTMSVALAVPFLGWLGQPWSARAATRTLAAFEAEARRRYGPGE